MEAKLLAVIEKVRNIFKGSRYSDILSVNPEIHLKMENNKLVLENIEFSTNTESINIYNKCIDYYSTVGGIKVVVLLRYDGIDDFLNGKTTTRKDI